MGGDSKLLFDQFSRKLHENEKKMDRERQNPTLSPDKKDENIERKIISVTEEQTDRHNDEQLCSLYNPKKGQLLAGKKENRGKSDFHGLKFSTRICYI